MCRLSTLLITFLSFFWQPVQRTTSACIRYNIATRKKTMEGSQTTAAQRRPSARRRRAMSAIARPPTAALRPGTASTKPRRPYSAYTKREGDASDGPKYDSEESNREWWRFYLKETPLPGAYRIGGFLDDLQRQPSSYRFRDSSRVKSASHQKFERHGDSLLPGAYETTDFLDETTKKKVTYGFKSIERQQGPKIGHGYTDKDIHTSPTWYNVVDYSEGADERNLKTPQFKSQVQRDVHSAHQFRIVKGPGPGRYDSSDVKKAPVVSSSFKSKVPRFSGRPDKSPGPGSYSYSDSVFGEPKPLGAVVQHMKKKHGLTVS